jgi:hypothetical protein
VHSFCIELMPDFQPISEVTLLSFFKSDISSSNHGLDFLPAEYSAYPSSQDNCL